MTRYERYAWDEVVGALPDPTEQPRKLSPTRAMRTGDDPLFTIAPPVYVELLSGRTVDAYNKALCPFHGDKNTPNLHAYPKPEQGWYCFACRKGGGIIEFAALLYGIEPRGADYRKLRQRIAAGLRGEST